MSSAYGHEIFSLGNPAAESSKAFYALRTEVKRVEHWNKAGAFIWNPYCSGRNCDEKPVYVTRYSYVTGRRGRVTDRIQYRCAEHGASFAQKYRLELPQVSA